MTAPATRRAVAAPLTPRAALRWASVAPVVRRLRPASILEIGCGMGSVGTRLARHGRYLGIEPDARAYAVARTRVVAAGGEVRHCADEELDPGVRADLVCAFEVLEHLADDTGAAARWLARVRPGGYLLLSVPADPSLFGLSDVVAGHYRRYTADSLRAVLSQAGAWDMRIWHYGWPVGRALDKVRDRVLRYRHARRAAAPPGALEMPTAPEMPTPGTRPGTPASGRLLQPGRGAGALIPLAVAPFALLQRCAPGRGAGLLALARPGSRMEMSTVDGAAGTTPATPRPATDPRR